MSTETRSAVRALPISFLADYGVADRHAAEVYADFRRDEDVPPETPWTAEEFEAFEAWLEEFYDPTGLDEYEVVRRELEAPEVTERPFPKPLASPCGDDERDFPF